MLYHALMENFKKDYRFEIICEDPDDLMDVTSKLQCSFIICSDISKGLIDLLNYDTTTITTSRQTP